MWLLIKDFALKRFGGFSSPINLLILVLSIFVVIFLYAKSEMIMTKLGFETKTSLREKILVLEHNVGSLDSANKGLTNAFNELSRVREEELRLVEELRKENEDLIKLLKNRKNKKNENIDGIRNSTKTDKEKEEEIKTANGTYINDLYNELFRPKEKVVK